MTKEENNALFLKTMDEYYKSKCVKFWLTSEEYQLLEELRDDIGKRAVTLNTKYIGYDCDQFGARGQTPRNYNKDMKELEKRNKQYDLLTYILESFDNGEKSK